MRKLEVTIEYSFTKTFESEAKHESNNLMAAWRAVRAKARIMDAEADVCYFLHQFPDYDIKRAIECFFAEPEIEVEQVSDNQTRYKVASLTIVETIS